MMSPVLVSSSTMKPEEKPAMTLRPPGLTARQRMSPALTPLARRNSCCNTHSPARSGDMAFKGQAGFHAAITAGFGIWALGQL